MDTISELKELQNKLLNVDNISNFDSNILRVTKDEDVRFSFKINDPIYYVDVIQIQQILKEHNLEIFQISPHTYEITVTLRLKKIGD